MEEKVGQLFIVGNAAPDARKLDVTEDRITLQGRETGVDGASLTLVAGNGDVIWARLCGNILGGGANPAGGAIVRPLKAIITVKAREVTIPFELKDLPLP